SSTTPPSTDLSPLSLHDALPIFLPPTRLALAHLAADKVGDGSGLFNLMRNLGGAIGLALIDTVVFSRGPDYADQIMDKVKNHDRSEEHTSELQSRGHLVCRLLLE